MAQNPNAEIPVVILCGGQGTRIREAADRLPKPLIDIGGQPISWHIMKLYGSFGFRRFILCLGYKSSEIKGYFLQYRETLADFTIVLDSDHEPRFHNALGNEDWEVTCAETGLATGTGGRIGRIERYIDTDTFMLTYGDGLGDVNVGELLRFHLEHGRIGTVTGVRPTSRFGEISVEGNIVTEFNENLMHHQAWFLEDSLFSIEPSSNTYPVTKSSSLKVNLSVDWLLIVNFESFLMKVSGWEWIRFGSTPN